MWLFIVYQNNPHKINSFGNPDQKLKPVPQDGNRRRSLPPSLPPSHRAGVDCVCDSAKSEFYKVPILLSCVSKECYG